MEYDVFICHASEDKEDFVEPLADALIKQNLKVWYDKFKLSLGDSLREKIDDGLSSSRYGVVVLSPAFFAKKWPKEELDGLVARQTSEDKKVILPIWHEVSYDDVKKFSPMLAGKLAAKSEEGLEAVVAQIVAVCKEELPSKRVSVFQTNNKFDLRAECLEVIRQDDIVGWRKLVDQETNETIEKLLAWKQAGKQAISECRGNWEPWKVAVREAVKISVPSFVPILAAIHAGKGNYWRESVALLHRLVLLYNDMGGGTTHVLRIGETILYIAGSVGMALATSTRQLNVVELWAGLTIPKSEGTDETTWCQTSKINYWQTGITGHNNDPYGFIVRLLELEDIKPFFDSKERFEQSLFMGNLLHSLFEFRNCAHKQEYYENLENEYWRPNVMPIWCLMKPNDFKREVWRIFGSSANVIKFAYTGVMPSAENLWPLWQAWKKKCVQFMSDGGKYHGHLHNIYSLNLPGEPEIHE